MELDRASDTSNYAYHIYMYVYTLSHAHTHYIHTYADS